MFCYKNVIRTLSSNITLKRERLSLRKFHPWTFQEGAFWRLRQSSLSSQQPGLWVFLLLWNQCWELRLAPQDQRAIRKSWSQGSPGAKEQRPEPLLLGPPFPAFFLYSRIPAGTAQESQAKRFSPLLLPHLPKQVRYHNFTNEINLRFQKQTMIQPQLLYMGYCLPLPPILSHKLGGFSEIFSNFQSGSFQ